MKKEKEISFTINGSYVYIKAVYISERQTGQQLMYGEWQNMYSGNALYIETKNIKNDYDQDIVKNLINIACKRAFDQLPSYQPDSLQHVIMGTVVGTYSPDDFINSLINVYNELIPSSYMEANKAQPASGEMLCFQCGQYVGSKGYRCEYCGEILCNEHKDPEKHYCPPFMENHPSKTDQTKQGPNDNEVYSPGNTSDPHRNYKESGNTSDPHRSHKKRNAAIIVTAIFLIAIIIFAGLGSGLYTNNRQPATSQVNSAWINKFISIVNHYRTENGSVPLTYSISLSNFSQIRFGVLTNDFVGSFDNYDFAQSANPYFAGPSSTVGEVVFFPNNVTPSQFIQSIINSDSSQWNVLMSSAFKYYGAYVGSNRGILKSAEYIPPTEVPAQMVTYTGFQVGALVVPVNTSVQHTWLVMDFDSLIGIKNTSTTSGTSGQSSNSSTTSYSYVPVSQIYDAYLSNAASANLQYKGKTMYVETWVANVVQNNSVYQSYGMFTSQLDVEMGGGVIYNWQNEKDAAQVIPNTDMIIECTVGGFQNNILTLNNCVVVDIPSQGQQQAQQQWAYALLNGISITNLSVSASTGYSYANIEQNFIYNNITFIIANRLPYPVGIFQITVSESSYSFTVEFYNTPIVGANSQATISGGIKLTSTYPQIFTGDSLEVTFNFGQAQINNDGGYTISAPYSPATVTINTVAG